MYAEECPITSQPNELLYPYTAAGGLESAQVLAHKDELNETMSSWSPDMIIKWAYDAFGQDLVLTSSFQRARSVAFILYANMIIPGVPVYFVDTGHHFEETESYVHYIVNRFNLNVVWVRPENGVVNKTTEETLWLSDPDSCCQMCKVDPLNAILKETGVKAKMTSLHRDPGVPSRANIQIITQGYDGRVQINPFALYSSETFTAAMEEISESYETPKHPLEDNYGSIGCEPCTQQGDGRGGRWEGHMKTTCGMHRSDY